MRRITALFIIVSISLFVFSACNSNVDEDWKEDYDTSLPLLGIDGWELVFIDNFDGDVLHERWVESPHGLRWPTQTKDDIHSNYWCKDAVRIENGCAIIKAFESDSHVCSEGICPQRGRFSGGIETRRVLSGNPKDSYGAYDEYTFQQAFGYFEARVKFPKADGLWAAFWLQSSNQRKIGNEGLDGTEIDIFESAFRNVKGNKMGHALLWDGYGKHSKVADKIVDVEQDLYDGFHTFALKWTPLYYVFYIDGKPTWATNAGGVSKVPQFLRFTIEIDAGDKYGPHGMKIGKFQYDEEPEFIIDYVKVYQNINYKMYEQLDENFPGTLDKVN